MLPRHSGVVDHYYVLNDCGIVTADRRDFASPFAEISFIFPKGSENSDRPPKVVVAEPRFGHRKGNRVFHGWIFGVRSKSLRRTQSMTDTHPFIDCQGRLARAVGSGPSYVDILKALDRSRPI
jgi:hypothetical protein